MGSKRFLIGAVFGLALAGSVAVATNPVTRAGATGLDISPGTAATGSTVTVTGSGFDGDCDAVLTWGRSDGLVVGRAPISDDGSFTTSVDVPHDARGGPNRLHAQGRQHGLDGCGADSVNSAASSVTIERVHPVRGRTIETKGRAIRDATIDPSVIARSQRSPVHAIVQLESLPEAGDLETLRGLGIEPLGYLNAKDGSGSAYVASVDAVDTSDAAFGRLVRGVHALTPADKIDHGLEAASTEGQSSIDSLVLFFDDVGAAGARAALDAAGVSAVDQGLNIYAGTLNRGQIQRLAAQDAVQFIAEAPEPGQLDLDNSRALINADAVQQLDTASGTYLGLSGFGVQVSIHDSGVDDHHGDFAGRMITLNHPGAGGDHGTHVASIAAGSGAMSNQLDDNSNPNGGTAFQWRGVAPQAGISAYGSQTAHSAVIMTAAIAGDGVDVSNHSYSYNDGQYNATMASIDSIIRGDVAGIPARPQVFSAGNQGTAPQFGENSGYYALSKSCKNCIIVANLQDGGALNGGSSHGPAPDGRLKPDVGANGSGVIAAGADVSNGTGGPSVGNSYRSKGGTSMAAPAVTGTIALLLQQYAEQYGVDLDVAPPLPSTMKAILIQTALDQVGTASGTNPDTGNATVYGPGPDWGTGYGSVDVQAGSQLIADDLFLEDAVDETNVTDIHYAQVAAGDDELRVTLAWDDLPGTPNADDSVPQLVNDLDLLLVGPNGEIVQPLVLPATAQFDCNGGVAGVQTGVCGGGGPGADPGPWPSAATAIDAAPGTDRLNNVEQVVVAAPAPGLWQVRVSVLNNDTTVRLPMGGTQSYSLAGVGDDRADLRVAKFDSPDPVHAGDELFYTVNVTNDGPDTAQDVVLVDTLPPEVVYLSDDGGCVYDAVAHELTCELGDLASGETISIRIKTLVESDTVVNEADGTLNIENTATVSSGTPDLEVTNNTETEITFVQDSADLQVTKLCKPDDPLLAGETGTCTIFVDNHGPSYARDVELTDVHFSDGEFTIVGVTTDQGSCSDFDGTVDCDLGDLANASVAASGRVTVEIDITATEDVDVNDVATVVSATPDPDTDNNLATGHLGVVAVADIAVTKDGPPNAVAGTSYSYDLTVTNNGPSTATGVVIEDVAPAGVSLVTVAASGGAGCNVGQPGNAALPTVCSFGTLAPSASRTMTVTVHVLPDTLGPIHNDARAYSDVLDVDLENNLASVTTEIEGSADLSISKTDSPDPVNAGDPLTYTIEVANAGPSTAFDVSIIDTLPAGTTFQTGVDGNGATVCASIQPDQVVCDIGTMQPGSAATVYLTVDVDPSLDPGTVLTNSATVSSSTADPDPTDNTVSEDTTVETLADVWIDKQAELRSGNPSNLVVYTLVVHNDAGCEADAQSSPTPTCGDGGPSDARDVVVTDVLPLTSKKMTVQYVSPECTYDSGTHVVTCSADVVPVGQTVTFVIEAQVSGSVGNINNEASVVSSTADPDAGNNLDAATIVHQGGTGGKGGGKGGGNGGGNGGGKP
ncbi:MAG: DUF11 domain-containing protein [Ilumatobacter sp.]|nr:DUF11 domain-containing protein [Ilumatobacter sp.]